MPKLVTSLTINAANKFVLQSPLDVFTATRKENIILGESHLESVANMIMSMIKLTFITLPLFSTKKMSFWNRTNINYYEWTLNEIVRCILHKKSRSRSRNIFVRSISSNNNRNDYRLNYDINSWRTETSFLAFYGNAWFLHEYTWLRNFQENL